MRVGTSFIEELVLIYLRHKLVNTTYLRYVVILYGYRHANLLTTFSSYYELVYKLGNARCDLIFESSLQIQIIYLVTYHEILTLLA